MKTQYDYEQVVKYATEAMKSMLTGIYSDPEMLSAFADAATANKRTAEEEMAFKAFSLARVMLKEEYKQKQPTEMS